MLRLGALLKVSPALQTLKENRLLHEIAYYLQKKETITVARSSEYPQGENTYAPVVENNEDGSATFSSNFLS